MDLTVATIIGDLAKLSKAQKRAIADAAQYAAEATGTPPTDTPRRVGDTTREQRARTQTEQPERRFAGINWHG